MGGAYVNEDSIQGAGYTFIFLGIISVATRFVVRRWKKVSIGIDDYFSLAALVFTISYCITMIIAATYHTLGSHGTKENSGLIGEKIVKATGILRNPAIGLTKLSVLFFYRRVFQMHNKGFRVAIWTSVALVSAWTIAFTFLDIFDCKTPISNLWKHRNECVNERQYNTAQPILDVAMDAILLVLPIPMIWRLQMSVRKKLLVSLVFVVGMFDMVAAILRLVYTLVYYEILTNKSSHPKTVLGLNKATDRIGADTLTWFWAMIEVGVGIVATCLPTLGPLLFESHSAYTSLKATLSGFVPLLGKDTVSEKASFTRRDSEADNSPPHTPTTHQMV